MFALVEDSAVRKLKGAPCVVRQASVGHLALRSPDVPVDVTVSAVVTVASLINEGLSERPLSSGGCSTL